MLKIHKRLTAGLCEACSANLQGLKCVYHFTNTLQLFNMTCLPMLLQTNLLARGMIVRRPEALLLPQRGDAALIGGPRVLSQCC